MTLLQIHRNPACTSTYSRVVIGIAVRLAADVSLGAACTLSTVYVVMVDGPLKQWPTFAGTKPGAMLAEVVMLRR